MGNAEYPYKCIKYVYLAYVYWNLQTDRWHQMLATVIDDSECKKNLY